MAEHKIPEDVKKMLAKGQPKDPLGKARAAEEEAMMAVMNAKDGSPEFIKAKDRWHTARIARSELQMEHVRHMHQTGEAKGEMAEGADMLSAAELKAKAKARLATLQAAHDKLLQEKVKWEEAKKAMAGAKEGKPRK